MRRCLFALAAAAGVAIASLPASAAPKQDSRAVYRVDSVAATVEGRKLHIIAKGAVRTGGWQNPQLKPLPRKSAEDDTLIVQFIATPPDDKAAVIQALLPISASVTLSLPRYATTTVKVVTETNNATAAIKP